jgi:hypothetical protein
MPVIDLDIKIITGNTYRFPRCHPHLIQDPERLRLCLVLVARFAVIPLGGIMTVIPATHLLPFSPFLCRSQAVPTLMPSCG